MILRGELNFAPRRRRRFWLLPLAAALLWWGIPRAAVILPTALHRADTALAEHFAPGYSARLDALLTENLSLHRRLAQYADAAAENDALRQLVGCSRVTAPVTPARLLARGPCSLTLACPDAAVGDAVLDASGRYLGCVTAVEQTQCTAALVGNSSAPTAGLCSEYAGILQVTGGHWLLTGIPADCAVSPGAVVTTPGGDWLGTVNGSPIPDADGLTAALLLSDTAAAEGCVFFIKR